jgi:hypothetical protein
MSGSTSATSIGMSSTSAVSSWMFATVHEGAVVVAVAVAVASDR